MQARTAITAKAVVAKKEPQAAKDEKLAGKSSLARGKSVNATVATTAPKATAQRKRVALPAGRHSEVILLGDVMNADRVVVTAGRSPLILALLLGPAPALNSAAPLVPGSPPSHIDL